MKQPQPPILNLLLLLSLTQQILMVAAVSHLQHFKLQNQMQAKVLNTLARAVSLHHKWSAAAAQRTVQAAALL